MNYSRACIGAMLFVTVLSNNLHAQDSVMIDENTFRSSTGARFIRDTSHALLGEAWRDDAGMVWGKIFRNGDGTLLSVSHTVAAGRCSEIGAQLPALHDYLRLVRYFGAGSPSGYYAQAPLGDIVENSWTMYDPSSGDTGAYVFNGSGSIRYEGYDRIQFSSPFRCVKWVSH